MSVHRALIGAACLLAAGSALAAEIPLYPTGLRLSALLQCRDRGVGAQGSRLGCEPERG